MPANEPLTSPPIVANVLAISAGRTGSVVLIGVAIAGLVLGGRALARAAGPDGGPGAATAPMVLGIVGAVGGGLLAASADGGLGSGNGRGGAYVAVVLGLVGIALGGLARARSRGVA